MSVILADNATRRCGGGGHTQPSHDLFVVRLGPCCLLVVPVLVLPKLWRESLLPPVCAERVPALAVLGPPFSALRFAVIVGYIPAAHVPTATAFPKPKGGRDSTTTVVVGAGRRDLLPPMDAGGAVAVVEVGVTTSGGHVQQKRHHLVRVVDGRGQAMVWLLTWQWQEVYRRRSFKKNE